MGRRCHLRRRKNHMITDTDAETVRQKVREGYGEIATRDGSCCGPRPTCCGSSPADASILAQHIGYSHEELAALPEGANMGLSCGNPTAIASLQSGEVVLDLGAGGGFDVFIAGPKVGPSGRALGVDMTPEMLAKARSNVAGYRQRTGLDNVEFRLGEIEHLPVADASVDVVISNCVINLSPDKPQVWREIARVLRPGGRVAVSDLALLKPLPPAVAEMVEALVGCVAGAVLATETGRMAKEAGLGDVVLNARSGYVDGMVDWQDPLYQKIISRLPDGERPSDYITSLEVTARKPIRTGDVSPKGAPGHRVSVLEVFDPAMCCSTGVCGADVDPKLVQFAADVKWLEAQGVEVRRYNFAQNALAYAENDAVKAAITDRGEAALPLLLVDGRMIETGRYPTREGLATLLGITRTHEGLFSRAVAELVAIGAAIASNCEPCLRHHTRVARELGVTGAEIDRAVALAQKVKEAPHRAILKLASRLTQGDPASAMDDAPDDCCANASPGCCG